MDYGHRQSDKMLKDLEKRLQEEYAQAERELAEKIAQYFKAYERKNAVKLAQLNAGQITQKEYLRWKKGQLLIGQRWQEMQDTIATDLHNVNKIAGAMISTHAKDVYALNHNYGTYEVEKGSLVDTSYTLYNRESVERLMRDNPDILPPPGKYVSQRIAEGKDVKWNKQQVQSVMTQSILQGESIPKIAKRLEASVGKSYTEDIIKNADKKTAKQIAKELARKNKAAAIRNARTMTTGAENAGRVDAYKRGQEMGVKSKQMWVATLDSRTRHEHRMLDGQTREVGEPFEVDGEKLRFPGDPSAPPYLVYNCRCGVIAVVKGSKLDKEGIEGLARRDEKLGDMTYDEWKNAKAEPSKPQDASKPDKGTNTPPTPEKAKNEPLSKPESKPEPVTPAEPEKPKHVVAQGKDLSDTYTRRPDEFAFEIEDAMNAQGFDGLPQVVSAKEFDKAVKAANNGEGFIAQRIYSAPDQETLDAYRDQLYNGKWYVDCSTGGAQYGKGMYCAADYTGTLSDGIKEEMRHYQALNDQRAQGSAMKEIIENTKKSDVSLKYKISDEQFEVYKRYLQTDPIMPSIYRLSPEDREIFKTIGVNQRKELDREVMAKAHLQSRKVKANSYTETLTLMPDAKILKIHDKEDAVNYLADEYTMKKLKSNAQKALLQRYDELQKGIDTLINTGGKSSEQMALLDKLYNERETITQGSDWDEIQKIRSQFYKKYTSKDAGVVATIMGYDAINAYGHGESGSYTVILNRTKVIFKEDKK